VIGVKADSLPEPLRGNPVVQIAMIVPDLESAVALWSGILGRDDWSIYTYGPDNVPELSYRGEEGRFGMRLAFVGAGPQIELIELLEGPSSYHEWHSRHGFGLHHLGFVVPSIKDAMIEMAQHDVDLIQSGYGYGANGDGGFAYYDTQDSVGAIVELIEVPSIRRPSEVL